MVKQKLKKYKNPIDETGTAYFVPCVAKNRDSLIYYIIGNNVCVNNVLSQLQELGLTSLTIKMNLHSLRFNDVLPDGKKIHELTSSDYDRMENELKTLKQDHPDNHVKPENHFFQITCPNCGNSYKFNKPSEIPSETFFCGLCERVLIDYTGQDDWEYEYYEA